MVPAMESARLKLGRAAHHLDTLQSALSDFVQPGPYTLRPDWDYTPGEQVFTCTLVVDSAVELPEEFSLITGDYLTNLRAALDHSIFDHVRARCPNLSETQISFPIVTSPARLNNAGAQFDTAVLAVITANQPYQASSYQEDPLWRLNALVNRDKHRYLLATNSVRLMIDIQPDPRYELIKGGESYNGSELTVGTRVCMLRFRHKADPSLHPADFVAMAVGFPISIDLPDGIPEPIIETLRPMQERVTDILDQLEQAGI